ncbi:MAG: multi-sensor hybrid histidine kinase [Bacteroidetes bacterium]|nr:multi-sensor hybrid histidine kinase [Bacteroidota bacterium]
MRKFLSWPIRVHLLLLVILLVLPSITLILYSGVVARDQAIEDAESECLKFVNAIAGEQQAAAAGAQQLVAALALLPMVQSRNGPATDALLSDLLKKNPLYSNIVISDQSGFIWASSTPVEGNLSIAGRKYFQDAVRSGTFSSGEFSVGRIAKKPVMTFAQPAVNASNELGNVIAVAMNLDYFQSLFDKINLPAGSSFSLLDHRGIILHRNSRDAFSEQLVGQPDIREELFTKMVEGADEGTYEAIGNDGKDRLTAYKKIRLPHHSQPYLYIRSSVPKATVVSRANTAMFMNMVILMSVFAVGLILALFIGKRMILDPVTKLKEASRQLTAGRRLVNVSGQVKDGELGELAHAFDDMAEALLRKEKVQLASEAAVEEARKSLETERNLLQSVMNGARNSHLVYLDRNFNFVRVNETYAKTCGYTPEEMIGKNHFALYPHEENEAIFARVRDTGIPEKFHDKPFVFPDQPERGVTYWDWTLTPAKGDAGSVVGLIYSLFETTERRRAEEELRKERDFSTAVLDTAGALVVVLDKEGRITRFNRACEEITGYLTEEVLGRMFLEFLIPTEDVQGVRQAWNALRAGDFPNQHENHWVAKDGARRLIAWSNTAITSGKGEIDYIIGTGVDITERKQAEEALQEANEALEQRVRERTMALQNLAEQLERSRHDLRKLASELVMAEERERKRIAGVLHDEVAQTLAAARMQLDLLQGISSDEKEKQNLVEIKALLMQSLQETRALMTDIGNPLLFDMGLKAACEALVSRLMERHSIRISCDIRDAYKHLDPDVKTILYQVVRELLNNVVKHSKAQNAHVLIDAENGHFRVKVTDDGLGFDPQMLGAPTVEGGFGLYSIRERLIAINGSLKIESTPGTGTVVTAILPKVLGGSQAARSA